MEEFENLMVKQAPLESYAEWFDSIVEEYVLSDKVCCSLPIIIYSPTQNRMYLSYVFIDILILLKFSFTA